MTQDIERLLQKMLNALLPKDAALVVAWVQKLHKGVGSIKG
jgi:hypothetical protein